jgi:peptidoglycan/LPS O-acetylase OafA/YrhL
VPQLDGLRWCAFVLVFLHHAPVFPGGSRLLPSLQALGWVGVDLFFVLSGYLLIALLYRERAATGTIDIRKFFIRRILRIWPLFYVFVGACFVHFMVLDGRNMGTVVPRTIGHLAFLDNVVVAALDEYNPLNFTSHLWTIAFEEQIYLLIPLLFAAIVVLRRHRILFAVVAIAIVASQPLLRWAFADSRLAGWVIPLLHFETVFAGLLLGAGVGSRLKERVPGNVLVLAGSLVLVFALSLPERTVYLFTLLALAFFLIVLGSLDGRSWIARLLARQPFVFLGRISYGLYVWHLAAIEYGTDLGRSWFPTAMRPEHDVMAWLSVVLPSLSLTVVLSVASYYAIERPFLRLKSRFTLVPNRSD